MNVPAGELQSGSIGTYGEKSLHSALKLWYAEAGDILEARVQGFQVDILHGETALEIQTGSFRSMKRKLEALLEERSVRLIYPVAVERTITRISEDGELISRRRSPKRGSVFSVCDELLSFPHLLDHPNFTLEVALVRDEEIRCEDGRGSWRRKGVSIVDRKLIEVAETHTFHQSADLARLLPAALPDRFTSRDAAAALAQPLPQIRKLLYCLRKTGAIEQTGANGRLRLYRKVTRERG